MALPAPSPEALLSHAGATLHLFWKESLPGDTSRVSAAPFSLHTWPSASWLWASSQGCGCLVTGSSQGPEKVPFSPQGSSLFPAHLAGGPGLPRLSCSHDWARPHLPAHAHLSVYAHLCLCTSLCPPAPLPRPASHPQGAPNMPSGRHCPALIPSSSPSPAPLIPRPASHQLTIMEHSALRHSPRSRQAS